jgi:hypothetical protein
LSGRCACHTDYLLATNAHESEEADAMVKAVIGVEEIVAPIYLRLGSLQAARIMEENGGYRALAHRGS